MRLSNETDQLFAALAKAQGELENVHKAKQAGGKAKPGQKEFAGYKYADLGACLDVARPVLKKFGLAVSQPMGTGEHGRVLYTILTHESGQYMQGEYLLEGAGMRGVNNAQQMGAAITYARRYCFAAIIGLAQEDDEDKMRKEQEEADQQAEVDRQQWIDNKRMGYQTATTIDALKDYHARTVGGLKQAGKRGELSKQEYNLRTEALTLVYRQVRDEKGFVDNPQQQGEPQQ